MKTNLLNFALAALTLCMSNLNAQEISKQQQIENLKLTKEKIANEERELLKNEVKVINNRLNAGDITEDEAIALKKEAAQKRALNIDNRLAIIDNQIALLERDETLNIKYYSYENSLDSIFDDFKFSKIFHRDRDHKNSRNNGYLLLAFGFNNAIEEGNSLSRTNFKFFGSRFFEIGFGNKYRIFKHSNILKLNYAFSFQINNLKPKDDQFFVENGNTTELQKFDTDLDKSKFRYTYLVMPVHLEFKPFNTSLNPDKNYFDRVKIGLGGFAGFNIGNMQKLKYDLNGDKIKDKQKTDFNTNDFVYGLSGYFTAGDSMLYLKYDLSPLFKNAQNEIRSISFGVRYELF
ncbi:MAG: hypothetical protein CVT96_09410 [Bacteroidetes bacterium HGW-Bacteroidetes-13]|nr:MAG: hypothetical protein CVT96_09410 [Bacteroidetes bacterium HGW-Bacteroidetes-13]